MKDREETGTAGWRWDHTYAGLPELFFDHCRPVPVAQPRLVVLNAGLARELGLDEDALREPRHAGWFAGNDLPEGAVPLAQAYAGHQFGHFTGLGDGRAVLLGEHLAPDGRRFDIQLKGAGRTRYSRGGDGRAALGPMLREYLVSEAMAALGIATTRALAVAATGESVMRDGPLPGAVLTRVAASHIRVGTFQWAAAHQDVEALGALLRHTARRHFPDVDPADARGFFRAVVDRQIGLVVDWMRVGFVHGVMNTDNVALSGETIDYGPCAFMDAYDPEAVFSSIDHGGRYAFANQPWIGRWNLARLGEALVPLFDADGAKAVDFANEVLGGYQAEFENRRRAMLGEKTGLAGADDADAALSNELLELMHAGKMDFTRTFRALCGDAPAAAPEFAGNPRLLDWLGRWQARMDADPAARDEAVRRMRASNPAVIPRNHLVEAALDAAVSDGDLTPFERLCEVLATPYEEPDDTAYTKGPGPDAEPYRTFCGT